MREKLQSFTLSQLKDIAKSAGLKGITGLKKEELIERLVELDAKMQSEKAAREAEEKKAESKSESKSSEKKASAKKSGEKKTDDKKHGEKKQDAKKSEEKKPAGEPAKEEKPAEEKKAEAPADASKNNRAENAYVPQEGDEPAYGILEVMPEGYGFIRCDNYLPGENDVYVSPAQIRKFGLRTGDVLDGVKKAKSPSEKFSPLVFLNTVNGYPLSEAMKRVAFENMTPIFPNERIRMETDDYKNIAMRVMDLVSPVGKGQRGMIVSPPKAGKTTLLKSVAQSILFHNPETHIIILLIDERPEEVTDMKEAIRGRNVEVIYSTFDEMPEHHARVSEMVIERARRLVEHREDVVILLDSITRLARAYNQVIPPSGRTLSGGLDPAALHMPKRFFGAARNMREGGSLTILATALVETGSKMDDVVYEEFKGTGNMEMILDRKLSEKRIFPAVDLAKSGTRREDLLLTREELRAMEIARRALNGLKSDDAADRLLEEFKNTRSNAELVRNINVRNHV
ncbi:MAG: transcription termination factor Rho [Lachnospiraceae bacterium]|nr:transcription termination factor Rho [Lachnospiraceae bacterium]